MSNEMVRAMLREIPLAHIEVYLQVLDSGVLKGRDAKMDDNGTICGGGCDAKGGACGAWCERADQYWGCFDQHGHVGITKEDFHSVIANPGAFRKALAEELNKAVASIANKQAPTLGPKVDAKLYVERG